jgi:UrcA family protein
MASTRTSPWIGATLVASLLLPLAAKASPPSMRKEPDSPPAATSSATTPDRAESRTIRIAYRDLDVATPQGLATLYVRIRHAAEEVCGAGRPPIGSRLLQAGADRCVRTAVADTIRQIGVPGLAALDAEQRMLDAENNDGRTQCDAPPRAKLII